MTTAINLQELEHELTRTKAMFEQWSGSMITRAQGCKAAHVAKMRAGKGAAQHTPMPCWCGQHSSQLLLPLQGS